HPLSRSEHEPRAGRMTAERVNDFAFKIGTVNGTGSASANGLIMQSIFRMGVPVSGKNVFPSNIQGLPTWYEIRASGAGHTGRADAVDLFVAMNPATYARDIAEVRPGGWVLHDSSWPLRADMRREDVTFLGIPLARMCVDRFSRARERILMKNIGYLGCLAALLDMDVDVVETLLKENFGRKPALLDSNFEAFRMGLDFVRENWEHPLPVRVAPLDAHGEAILIDGNTAAALGCMYAGATVAAWYPITPSTSLVDAFTAFCGAHRKDPETGKNRFAILQAEDELAAAGMVIGAGWAGARAFTATSGPGISLMGEFIGLAYYAEIPSVFFDVQRTGPSTGMPTRTQQGDLTTVVYASHGDTRHIALFPADPRECFDFAVRAFDLAERYQTPVFLVSDLDIGMNDWVVPPLEWDDGYRPDRGKVLGAEELEEAKSFHRYLDVDGDGVPYRTLPGVHPAGAYFTRGSGHDAHGRYTEDAGPYTEVVDRLDRKVGSAAKVLPEPETRGTVGARYGLLTVGGCRGAVLEAMERLAARGIDADFMRVRGFPFPASVAAFVDAHETTFVVEQNRDAQLRTLLINEAGARPEKLLPVLRYGGLPLAAGQVVDGVLEHLGLAGVAENSRTPNVRETASATSRSPGSGIPAWRGTHRD
ncbi:MAG TPA: 2-oxoacid:acceptor oxidoreductase subunit alpha, partial [Longimicrobiales bacterium]|nr:2-oxoacid:acceptor oxidoreductase subunit alpha [Longimicrobiales bacterium]